MKGDVAQKRYEIIEPFLKKEKTLKEISKESDVSYSTVKRWAKKYRKKGKEGLDRSKRSDSNTYRSISKEVEDFIGKTYKKNPNMNIKDIYDKVLNYIKNINEKKISYNTVYRIVNNLDPFMKKYVNIKGYEAKKSNQRFQYVTQKLDIEVLDETDDRRRNIYLNIIFDSYSMAIACFSVSFEKLNFDEVLLLLRRAIIKDTNYANGIPEEFIINDLKKIDNKRVKEISEELGIDVGIIKKDTKPMDDFYNDFQEGIPDDVYLYSEIKRIINDYIKSDYNFVKGYYEKWNQGLKIIKKIEDKNILNDLLIKETTERKVHRYGIRFKNIIYNNRKLSEIQDEKVIIRYDTNDMSWIKVYYKGKFYCHAESEIQKRFDLQELRSYIQILKIKYFDSNINIANLQDELRDIIIENLEEYR